uniref:Uncharacterized protein n=1 Tax=Quercus lobata TaxID=97700 RepID=A0A7N2L715_QUELO
MDVHLRKGQRNRKFGVPSKAFAARPPKIIDNVISSSSPSSISDGEETPSGTSRIQLRKEMNMILTPPLTKEIEEDDASQIYYMELGLYFLRHFYAPRLAYKLNKLQGMLVMLDFEIPLNML